MSFTTFITPFGRYQFKRLPFGLTSAPEVFQRQISQLLEGLDGVICHFDDIIIYGKNMTEHNKRLEAVLIRLSKAGWSLNSEKCSFRQTKLKILGHIVSEEGIYPDPEKVKAIVDLPSPENTTELKRLLGMVNFVAKFIPNLSDIAYPLYELLRLDVHWIWGNKSRGSI